MNKIFQNNNVLIVILACVIGIYANTFWNDYALDDTLVITHNEFTKQGLRGIPDILSNDGFVGFFGSQDQLITGGRYRPMAQIFFAIEYQLFGLNPFFGHLLNVIFYAISCGFVFVILSQLFTKQMAHPSSLKYYFTLPFIATMVFAIHPLHTEVVANIKGRDEIFSFLGSLGALYFALKYADHPKKIYLFWIFLTFLFGLFSKESALPFFVIIPLTLSFFNQNKTYSLSLYKNIVGVLALASVLFLCMRFYALGFWIGNSQNNEILNNPYLYASSAQRLATVLYTWLIYFKLLIFPYPLTHDYYPHQIPILDFGDYQVWIAFLVTGFLIYYAIKNFRKNKIVSYGILFFFITFSMVSNLVLNIGTFMNERFVYTPLLGFAIIVGYWCQAIAQRKWPENTRILAAVLGIVFLTLSILTIKRNRAWENDLTLFTTDVKTSTNSAKVNVSAGGKLSEYAETLSDDFQKQKSLNQAYQYLHKGVKLHPKNHQAWFLLGNCCRALGTFNKIYYDEAYRSYNNAISLNPNMKEAQNNILYTAQQIKEEKNYDLAKKFFHLAIKYYSQSSVWCDYAECCLYTGRLDSAEMILDNILVSEPQNITALNKKAEIFGLYKSNLPMALNTLTRAYKVDSSDLTTNENLGIVYGLINNCERSVFHLNKALSRDPSNPRIKENLRRTYAICENKN